jgi:hypothetical protein
MLSEAVKNHSDLILRKEIINFKERPICPACKISMSICSHSTPSIVVGFGGKYYTEYVEYTCTNKDCQQYKKKKYRAPNPWRMDRHKYDLEIEGWIVEQRHREKKTYEEIKNKLKDHYDLEITSKTIGNIICCYEIAYKSKSRRENPIEFRKNGGAFIGIDAMGPFKGEDKHIVAIDHYTNRTVLVERVRSENTETHIMFQRNLKKYAKEYNFKVLGFISDDHVAQRKAIYTVWGRKMKHCRCHFHFKMRIMEEAFALNSKLKTDARAKLRNIYYIKLIREDNLEPVENSKVWDYIYEAIKDLFALQDWKIKRNDTDLESIVLYERLDDIYGFLTKLGGKIFITPETEYIIEKKRLKVLIKEMSLILTENEQAYENLKIIKGHQNRLRKILEAHNESSKIGLEKLKNFAGKLEKRLESEDKICKEEKFFIEKLCSFVSDRGESLFHYRDIKNAEHTNNNQEKQFRTLKHDTRRTQGGAAASRYFQNHGKYSMYVNPNASIEEIKEILMNADYKEIARIMKQEREARKKAFPGIKDTKKWRYKKKSYEKKFKNI